MRITLTDGQTITLAASEVSYISIEAVAADGLDQLAGPWRLIAMPNGSVGADGIHTSTPDTIAFTAAVAPDGLGLICQSEAFYTRSGNTYPAQWRMLVERDAEQSQSLRLGWVLDQSQPASDKEFDEAPDKYLDQGAFYWGDGTEEHHYIYLLSENISTQRLEGMTLWSGWGAADRQSFTFPQNQEVYAVVAAAIPYAAATSVGYIDIWASARFERLP